VLSPVRLSVAGLAIILVFGAGIWVGRATSPPPIEILLPPSVSPSSADLRVDVKGAVRAPGVYHLAPNARVIEALDAAGGAVEDADLNQLNLAAKVTDEGLVVVPRKGETLPNSAPRGLLVNINTANEAELKTLPGIGDVRARQIAQSRATDGQFVDPIDLLSRNLVPTSIFEQIKGNISVR